MIKRTWRFRKKLKERRVTKVEFTTIKDMKITWLPLVSLNEDLIDSKSGWGWRTWDYVVSEHGCLKSYKAGALTLVEVIGLVLFLHLQHLEFHFLRNVKGDLRKLVCEWELTCREHCQICFTYFSCLNLCLRSRQRSLSSEQLKRLQKCWFCLTSASWCAEFFPRDGAAELHLLALHLHPKKSPFLQVQRLTFTLHR